MIRRLERYFTNMAFSLLGHLIRSEQPTDLPGRRFRRILVIRQHDQLGDMLCAVPLLRGLRERYPGARIALMTSPVNHEVMLHSPYVDKVIRYDKKEFLSRFFLRPVKLLKFIRMLRSGSFELAIVPSTVSLSATSDLLAYLSGSPYRIGAGQIDGVKNPSGAFFNGPTVLDWRAEPHRHQALRNLDIARALGLNVTDLSSRIGLAGKEVARAREFLASAGMSDPFVVYHPGAGKPPNRWPAGRFADLANTLGHDFSIGTVITRGPMDDEPVALMQSKLTVPYLVVSGKSIREVAAILSLARLVVSNDTGIMHVAAAAGTRVLSLFGPTDPRQWAPIDPRHRYIEGRGGDIGSITVEEVVAAARGMIQDQHRRNTRG